MRLPTPVLLVVLTLTVAVLCGLGVWQVQRHQWKQGLVAERAAQLAAPPLETPAVLDLPSVEVAWRRVHLVGTWDHSRSMVLANRVRYGIKGEELVTPLFPAAGGPAVLVDRGWYPEAERDRVRASLDAERQASIEGLAVDATGRTARQTAQRTWTGLAPESMAEAAGIPLRPWAIIQGTVASEDGRPPAGGALPVQRYQPFANTTPHLQYALTWFGIAAALVGVAVARFVVAPLRARQDAAAQTE
ncbi:MAG: SURF1 family protein [Dehalococcoidia bacterium]|nr:MAG: SURF1 family protein [Dehalococcoidia bacterium]